MQGGHLSTRRGKGHRGDAIATSNIEQGQLGIAPCQGAQLLKSNLYGPRCWAVHLQSQDLWIDKTCPARTQLSMSWKLSILTLLVISIDNAEQSDDVSKCNGYTFKVLVKSTIPAIARTAV